MNTQLTRRKFIKIAGLGGILLPFAGLLAYSATKCKDEVEYGGWKQYAVNITRVKGRKEQHRLDIQQMLDQKLFKEQQDFLCGLQEAIDTL